MISIDDGCGLYLPRYLGSWTKKTLAKHAGHVQARRAMATMGRDNDVISIETLTERNGLRCSTIRAKRAVGE